MQSTLAFVHLAKPFPGRSKGGPGAHAPPQLHSPKSAKGGCLSVSCLGALCCPLKPPSGAEGIEPLGYCGLPAVVPIGTLYDHVAPGVTATKPRNCAWGAGGRHQMGACVCSVWMHGGAIGGGVYKRHKEHKSVLFEVQWPGSCSARKSRDWGGGEGYRWHPVNGLSVGPWSAKNGPLLPAHPFSHTPQGSTTRRSPAFVPNPFAVCRCFRCCCLVNLVWLLQRLHATMTAEGQKVNLKSSDDREFAVDLRVAQMSVTIKNMLEGSQDPEHLAWHRLCSGRTVHALTWRCPTRRSRRGGRHPGTVAHGLWAHFGEGWLIVGSSE